jgi:hypothetical protein
MTLFGKPTVSLRLFVLAMFRVFCSLRHNNINSLRAILQNTDFAARCQRFTGSTGGSPMPENNQFWPLWPPARHAGHFDLGSGYLTAFALFSAKSGGTENARVFRS